MTRRQRLLVARRHVVQIGVLGLVAAALVAVPAPAAFAASPPGAPVFTFVTAGPAVGAVKLFWRDVTKAGVSPVTAHEFARSLDGGVTWSAPKTFATSGTSSSSDIDPQLFCTNTAPGSKGCAYRIYARNAAGLSPASASAVFWSPPSAPASVHVAAVDPAFATVTLKWPAAKVSGELPVTYDVFGSMDGQAAQLLTNGAALSATVACTGAITCAYKVRARNSQGTSAFTAQVSVGTAPSLVKAMVVQHGVSNLSTGVTSLHTSWSAPATGLPPVLYRFEQCTVPAGSVVGCGPTSTHWSPQLTISLANAHLVITSCPAGVSGCYVRVRAVNARGGGGGWRALSLEPWAPFGVKVSTGRTRGTVSVSFSGPAESGPGANSVKHYLVFFCSVFCVSPSNWHNSGLRVAYPPSGKAPFAAGSFVCSTSHFPTPCEVRMQFVSGTGTVGNLSRLAAGFTRGG